MSECEGEGSCLLQCGECLNRDGYGKFEKGCESCEKGYYKEKECKFNCKPIKCPVFHYCKQWNPQVILDCQEGFCAWCAVMLCNEFSKQRKKEELKEARRKVKKLKRDLEKVK